MEHLKGTRQYKVRRLDLYIQKLYEDYKLHPYHLNIQTITITPKGKDKTHEEILNILKERACQTKSIRQILLVRESSTTNHFHGIIITSQASKLFKLNSKRNYHLHIVDYYDDVRNTWINYIYKTNPKYMDLYQKRTQQFTLMAL